VRPPAQSCGKKNNNPAHSILLLLSFLRSSYVYYNGTIENNPPTDYKAYDYGERLAWGTSVKYTCCESDVNDYDTNGATHDPSEDGEGVANGAASNANIAAQRMCPPPEGGTLGNLRYNDSLEYVTNLQSEPGKVDTDTVTRADGSTFTQHCFHNRTLKSPVHLASIKDYYEIHEDRYMGINQSDVGLPYLEDPADAWLQEKYPESFYQLCVAERRKKTLCCDGLSEAPCQPASTASCRYPGFHVNSALAHCGTVGGVSGAGCDCSECTGAAIDPTTWTPRIDGATSYSCCLPLEPQLVIPNPNFPNPQLKLFGLQMSTFFSKK
tara:strand:+ start:83 stop:1054 length:972 start_codon:yes stop_codon:yes gene_type:complete